MPRGLIPRLAPLLILYASKTGALVVGLLILPQFSKLLGPSLFGVVAVILSVQQLLLTLDLGMSVVVGRELALTHGTANLHDGRIRQSAEALILLFFLLLLPLALLVGWLLQWPLPSWQIAVATLLCWALTSQNIGQIALLAKRDYVYAAALQITGVALRGVATLFAMRAFEATLSVFLLSQLAISLLHWQATRMRCAKLLVRPKAHFTSIESYLSACKSIARQGKHVALSGVAGAFVMQMDKPIVGALISAADTAPYFLAMTLCLTPLTALAWPVSQFFQPRLVTAISSADHSEITGTLLPYVWLTCAATVLPTAMLWMWRDTIVSLWLGPGAMATAVANYCAVLLPGAAIGALGYMPYSILIAHADYKFQARLSTTLSVGTLLAVSVCAWQGSVIGVCAAYVGYFSAATGMSWLRAARIQGEAIRYVQPALRHMLISSGALLALAVTLFWLGAYTIGA